MLYDWLVENTGYSTNFKEYLAWFRLPYGFEYMKVPGLPLRASVKRVILILTFSNFRLPKPSKIWDSDSPNITDNSPQQVITYLWVKETINILRLSKLHLRRIVLLIGISLTREPIMRISISKLEPPIHLNDAQLKYKIKLLIIKIFILIIQEIFNYFQLIYNYYYKL